MQVGWVRTYTGKHVCLLRPNPSTIDVVDIAHHLSMESRWAGATTRHYSVAEHSIWVARLARELVEPSDREVATVHALIHDAAEYLLKDVPTPFKALLGEGYKKMSDGLDSAIRASLGLGDPSPAVRRAVKFADRYAAWCEAKALLVPCGQVDMGDGPPEELLVKVPMVTDVRRQTSITIVKNAYLSYLRFALRQL